MKLKVYQTLEDRNNADHVEENAPFPSNIKSAWLGYGYYVWDSDEKIAHWWGETKFTDNYMICEGELVLDDSCWDLHGNGNHLKELRTLRNEIIEAKISTGDKLLVHQIVEFFKKKGAFKYKAIRASSIFKKLNSRIRGINDRVSFKQGNVAYMPMHPVIQICLIQKGALHLRNMYVIFPKEYKQEFI